MEWHLQRDIKMQLGIGLTLIVLVPSDWLWSASEAFIGRQQINSFLNRWSGNKLIF